MSLPSSRQFGLASNNPRNALEAGSEALALTVQRLLPEFAEPWVEERRKEIEERRLDMLEVCARAGLMLGGHELAPAERSARALVAGNPYRESGYALLMRTQAARGDTAEALRVYHDLRMRLRDELGILPSPALVQLSERLLGVGQLPVGADALNAPKPRRNVSATSLRTNCNVGVAA